MHALVPPRLRPVVSEVAHEIDEVLGQFVRGQLLVMLILAVLYSVAYSLIGVRLAVPIGIVAGLLSFIPYAGGATALGLALLMCLMVGTSWPQIAGVVAAYAVIQALEGFVITPRIMEEKVGLSAVWVLLALLVFGELFGFFGVLIAVPAAAVTKIFVLRALAHYRKSQLFTGATGPGAEPAVAAAAAGSAPVPAQGATQPARDRSERPRSTPKPATSASEPAPKVPSTPPTGASEPPPKVPSTPPKGASEPPPKVPSTPPKGASEPPKAAARRPVKTRSTGNKP